MPFENIVMVPEAFLELSKSLSSAKWQYASFQSLGKSLRIQNGMKQKLEQKIQSSYYLPTIPLIQVGPPSHLIYF